VWFELNKTLSLRACCIARTASSHDRHLYGEAGKTFSLLPLQDGPIERIRILSKSLIAAGKIETSVVTQLQIALNTEKIELRSAFQMEHGKHHLMET